MLRPDVRPNGQSALSCTQSSFNQTLTAKSFTFNAVFDQTATQSEMMEKSGVARIIAMAMEGYSTTVFCYGQTGSGKTHTLTGPPHLVNNQFPRKHLKEVVNKKENFLCVFAWCVSTSLVPRPTGSFLGRARPDLPSVCSPLRPVEREGSIGLHLRHQSFLPGNIQRKSKKKLTFHSSFLLTNWPSHNYIIPRLLPNWWIAWCYWVLREGSLPVEPTFR